MQSASGSYRNLAALAEGFGSDALAEGKHNTVADSLDLLTVSDNIKHAMTRLITCILHNANSEYP